MEYFAKSVPNGGSKEEQVTLKQHLDDTVECILLFLILFVIFFDLFIMNTLVASWVIQ